MKPEQARISNRQAAELLRRRVDGRVHIGKVYRYVRDLVKLGRLSDGAGDEEGGLSPDDVDRLAGEVWRGAAGWYQKRNVTGDFYAWVDMADGKERRLLPLPWERTWDKETKVENLSPPVRIRTWEWPSARWTGTLVLVEDDGEGIYPLYVWEMT